MVRGWPRHPLKRSGGGEGGRATPLKSSLMVLIWFYLDPQSTLFVEFRNLLLSLASLSSLTPSLPLFLFPFLAQLLYLIPFLFHFSFLSLVFFPLFLSIIPLLILNFFLSFCFSFPVTNLFSSLNGSIFPP